MRARNIKPAYFKNDQLARCSTTARLLFAGLWCLADCEGRLENRPLRIRMELLPADNVDAVPLLDELAAQGLILFYGADLGEHQPYIWIPNFLKHQTPHQKEREGGSKIPPHPDQPEECPKKARDLPRTSPRLAPDKPETNRADSLDPDSLDPDSLDPDSPAEVTPSAGARTSNAFESVLSEWNKIALKADLSQSKPTDKRRASFNARWKDLQWRNAYQEALLRIPESTFLCGGGDKGWKANFDWFLKPDSVSRLSEGVYDNGKSKRQEIGITGPSLSFVD